MNPRYPRLNTMMLTTTDHTESRYVTVIRTDKLNLDGERTSYNSSIDMQEIIPCIHFHIRFFTTQIVLSVNNKRAMRSFLKRPNEGKPAAILGTD